MSEISNAIIVSPLDEKMEQELTKHNVTDSVIATLKSKYGDLKLRSLNDREVYMEIKAAKKDVAKVRTAVVKCCKEGRDEALKIQKQWIAKEKEVLAKVADVESPLDAQIEAFEQEVKRKEQEEKQKREEQYMSRTQSLTKLGALYHNSSFTLGDFTLEAALVKESSESVWADEILPRFMEEHLKLEAERAEQEAREVQRRAELKKQQEELELREAEFRKQKAEYERQRQEAEREQEKIRNELQQKRISMMVGFSRFGKQIDMSTLWSLSEAEYNDILAEKKKLFEEWEVQRDRQVAEAAAQRERQRIEEEQRQAEIRRQQEEARKMEELAKAGDKALWEHFIEQVQNIKMPDVKSGQYRKAAKSAKENIAAILALKPY